jgi:hypothetical protein
VRFCTFKLSLIGELIGIVDYQAEWLLDVIFLYTDPLPHYIPLKSDWMSLEIDRILNRNISLAQGIVHRAYIQDWHRMLFNPTDEERCWQIALLVSA